MSELKTHPIVTEDCLLRTDHIGKPVTYKGVTGWLIRYVTTCEHHLLALSLTEVRECLELNYPTDEVLPSTTCIPLLGYIDYSLGVV